MILNITRLEDNRIRIDVESGADEWGVEAGAWYTIGPESTPEQVAAAVGAVVMKMRTVPGKRPAQDGTIPLNLDPNPPADSSPPAGEPGEGSILEPAPASSRLATSGRSIRLLIDAALSDSNNIWDLRLSYIDRNGNDTEHVVRPIKIERQRFAGQLFEQDYLLAYDPEADGSRQFKLDRIKWAERA